MKSLVPLLALSLSAAVFAAEPSAPRFALTQEAIVLSTIDHPQYTYIEVSQNKQTKWLAATRVKVKKGDVIRFDDGMVMTNFHSKSLNRTFPSIAFVNQVSVGKDRK